MSAVAELEERYRARSLWLDQLSEPLIPRASLPGDIDCDAAIVGAGFTGLWSAYYLKRAQPDLRVVVLEAEIAGYGPSGRNGGWASSGIAGSPRVYERRSGHDGVVRGTRETMRTVDEIGEVAVREQIDCGYVKAGMLTIATSAVQEQRLRESVSGLRAGGMTDEDVRVLTPDQVVELAEVSQLRAASFSPQAARIDPARLVRGLAQACERLGVQIFERTRALSVAPGAVRCEPGIVRAEIVLRATESYTTQLEGSGRDYLPLYSLMIATEPLGEEAWAQHRWTDGLLIGDRHHLFFYAQRTADGRIAIGGRGAPYRLGRPVDERNERDAAVRRRLETALRSNFAVAAQARVTHHWGGPLAVPRDWSMSVNFDRSSGFGFAGGYVGHGLVPSNISGRTLADLALGRDTDLVSLPWVGHRSRRWEPEPLRYLASSAIVRMLGAADSYEDRHDRRAMHTLPLRPFLPPG
ncbi:MAG: NAD(P)/FAD-dependent oxidoreductase [Solirubrobacteraceae bacterium]